MIFSLCIGLEAHQVSPIARLLTILSGNAAVDLGGNITSGWADDTAAVPDGSVAMDLSGDAGAGFEDVAAAVLNGSAMVFSGADAIMTSSSSDCELEADTG